MASNLGDKATWVFKTVGTSKGAGLPPVESSGKTLADFTSMWSCPEKRNRFQFQASNELFYKMQGKKSTQGIMNNAPLPASLSHILEVGNTVFVVVSRVSVCCCWAITSQNHLFPLPFLVYFYFQRMGLWSRAVDRKAFSKPPATLEILGLAGVPFLPHFLCLQYWDLPNTWCRCSGGSPGPFSDPFAMAVKEGVCIQALLFSCEPSLKVADGLKRSLISHR